MIDKNLLATSVAAPSTTDAVDVNLSVDPVPLDTRTSRESAVSAKNSATLVTKDLVVVLKTDCIRVGPMPNRAPDAYTSSLFDDLCASINSARRNTQLIQVRALTDSEKAKDPQHQYELISGERRLRACIECDLPVHALVVAAAHTSNFAMDALIENLHREDLSPHAFGRQILHVLASDPSLSMRRLALKLGCDVSNVSRARDVASLPSEVTAAFASSDDIRYADAKPLTDAVALSREAVIAEAQRIAKDRQALKPAEIVGLISTAAKRATTPKKDELEDALGEAVERGASGWALICAEKDVGSVKLDKQKRMQINLRMQLSEDQQSALAKHIESFIQRRVLSKSAEKATAPQPQAARPTESAATLSEELQAVPQKRRGVA